MSIDLHPGQSEVFSDLFVDRKARFSVVVCSRGWGKSYLTATCAVAACYELLELDWSVPNKYAYIVAPTYDQVTDIYWPLIMYELGMEGRLAKASRDDGRFMFGRNVELRLVSYEAVERMRGKGAYFLALDELASWRRGLTPREAWEGILQPTVLTRWSRKRAAELGAKSPGRALAVSTPKGYDFLYDMYNFREIDPEWRSYRYDYRSSPFLDAEEIDRIRHTVDPLEFAREYEASFKGSGNNVFYCFDRSVHVRRDLEDFRPPSGDRARDGEDVHVCIDFNVGLQCSSAFALRGKQAHWLEEFKGHPDTETLAVALKERYRGHRIFGYPDPSGKARKTSAPVGQTDFSILESHGIQCLSRQSAPPIVDSVAAVNRLLKTAAGDVRMYVHPRCTGLIASLERTSWSENNPDTATLDKKEGVEHFSDGVRYAVEYLFPIRRGQKVASRGFGF